MKRAPLRKVNELSAGAEPGSWVQILNPLAYPVPSNQISAARLCRCGESGSDRSPASGQSACRAPAGRAGVTSCDSGRQPALMARSHTACTQPGTPVKL